MYSWHHKNKTCTDSIKINRPGYNICLYWANFWQPTIHVQQKVSEKTLKEVLILYLYASFGTFSVQIGQLFEAQWIFEVSLKIGKSLWLKEYVDFTVRH